MGCGSSSSGDGYKINEENKKVDNSPMGRWKRRGTKILHSGPDTVVVPPDSARIGERPEGILVTSATTFSKLRLPVKSNLQRDFAFISARKLAQGISGVERGPPVDKVKATNLMTIVPDFSPPFSLNLTQAEHEDVIKYKQRQGRTAMSYLEPRLVNAALKNMSLRPIGGYCQKISSLALSLDEKVVLVSTIGKKIKPSRQVKRPVTDNPETSVVSNMAELLLNASTRIYAIDVRTSERLSEMKDECGDDILAMQYTADGQMVVSSTTDVIFAWDLSKRRVKKVIEQDPEFELIGRINFSKISPCGKLLAVASENMSCGGQVSVWKDLKQYLCFMDHNCPSSYLAFSDDSSLIASGDEQGEVLVWKVESGKWVCQIIGHSTPIRHIHFVEKGKLLVVDDSHVVLWDILRAVPVPFWTRDMEKPGPEPFTGTEPPTIPEKNTLVPFLGGGCALSCGTFIPFKMFSRQAEVIDPKTGETLLILNTQAPLCCGASGASTATVGDLWGNVYLIDVEYKGQLPTMK